MDTKEVKAFIEGYRGICDEVAIEEPMNWDNRHEFDFLENVYGDRINRQSLDKYPKEVCPFPFYSQVVHASGDVSVCCVDWEKKTVVGNIFTQSLKEIWHGSELRSFRRMHIERRREQNTKFSLIAAPLMGIPSGFFCSDDRVLSSKLWPSSLIQ